MLKQYGDFLVKLLLGEIDPSAFCKVRDRDLNVMQDAFCELTNQPTNQPIDQSINQSINQKALLDK